MNRLTAQFIFLSLCSAFFVFLVFSPGLSGDFVLDDGFNILDNRVLYLENLSSDSLINAAFSFHDGNGARPLPMLSFALDYWRAGSMDATAFKTTNLIIHLLTTVFLAFFFRRLLVLAGCAPEKAAWGALVLALAWAVHPLQVSSVMYVVQRMQTMATMFLVLALWAYLGMRQLQIVGSSRGRLHGILVLVFFLLAVACKEDAPLLFFYVLALELTVLRFRAVQPDIARGLRQSFLVLTVLAGAIYVFVVVPHYWQWEAYTGRDFSSLERLMTQARVLVMHLGQIVFPYPDNMTFLYDSLAVSRSLWSPWTTLPSLLLILGLLIWAWRWRARRPLFSLGVFLFFSGHFITSNVIGLELVFEHRNHFPLIGAVLAIADLAILVGRRFRFSRLQAGVCLAAASIIVSTATVARAYTWGDPVRHGEKQVELHPYSVRAWTQLGGAHFDLYKATKEERDLRNAIRVNAEGFAAVEAPQFAGNLVIYKSVLGEVTDNDWQRFLDSLRDAPRSWQNKFVVWTMMTNVERGIDIDPSWVVKAIDVLTAKTRLSQDQYLRMAVFIYKFGEQQDALPYFLKFAESAAAGDDNLIRIIQELTDAGHSEWSDQLREIEQAKQDDEIR
ncbi:DUF3488 domain-containing protein [Marinobacter sp. F3R08]|uniref:DUF3488 domain-containing protein n=1 Tax=Marinobacter sp. F3R08 TaxID=2841559 RepID=UPI001C09D0E0|nr:hypothetical protein [Marinobacter sp. F3R08]MBU2954482.1 hypothetical protein [Marinobacter sp. F3R08]